MLTDSSEFYGLGALKLIKSSKRSISQRYVVDFAILELEEKLLPLKMKRKLEEFGWSFMTFPRIPPNDEANTFPRFRDQFSKLQRWSLEQYDRVIYLDSDCFVIGSLDSLISMDISGAPLWVTRDFRGQWVSTFNMGVFMIRPNRSEYERLLRMKHVTTYEVAMSEQGFLNVVYPTWGDIGFENNANLFVYSQDRPFWDDRADQINVIHYTMNKPWECGVDYEPICALWNDFQV